MMKNNCGLPLNGTSDLLSNGRIPRGACYIGRNEEAKPNDCLRNLGRETLDTADRGVGNLHRCFAESVCDVINSGHCTKVRRVSSPVCRPLLNVRKNCRVLSGKRVQLLLCFLVGQRALARCEANRENTTNECLSF